VIVIFLFTPIYKDYYTPSADCASWIPWFHAVNSEGFGKRIHCLLAFILLTAFIPFFQEQQRQPPSAAEHDVKITKERQADIQGRFYG
jgi:hypothetical protein